ncbi:DUF4386 domain-containing protein [Actinoplanes sp. NPDC026619]|uniref:DUF4386 domain-containing protein n=1 Tax=Actinoplanes sp. NPDC026619 TaxID=3155798 RepID=UPI0033E97972
MTGIRKTALVAGLLYLITFVSSIPALFLLSPVLHHADYIISAGADTRVVWGCLLDVVNALAAIGTAVALFPVVKRQNEGLALGFVMSRMLEGAVVLIGVVSLLAIVTLRQNPAGADPATLLATGHSLVAVRDWTFLLGPGLMPAFNALLLGTLLFRSRLVPRLIPLIGLIGAPLLLAADLATLFGHNTQTSAASFLLTLPVAAWELSVGLYLTIKGFRPSPILPGPVATPTPDRSLATIA